MNRPSKVAFHTLGCKLNYSETESIASQFRESGFEAVDFSSQADLYIINTCSVTENADRECGKIVRKAKRIAPDSTVAVIGCYAQLKPDAVNDIEGVNMVLGMSEKFKVLQHFRNFSQERPLVMGCDIDEVENFIPSESNHSRTRSFVKVQDGCNYNCSFCTIPLARGKSRSDTISNVLARVKKLIDSGAREIVLSGINLGDFQDRSGNGKIGLLELLQTLTELDELERLRLSSIEPNLLSDRIIDLAASSPKIMPHFHIPLQSGSDKILGLMRRRYKSGLFLNRIQRIKEAMPNCCVGADVICGFPGESDEDFLMTTELIQSAGLSYLHAFSYSERDNTAATHMANSVPLDIRQKRSFALRSLSSELRSFFYRSQIGKTFSVLFEAENKDGFMHGYTDNYIRVKTEFNSSLINEIVDCTLGEGDISGRMNVVNLHLN